MFPSTSTSSALQKVLGTRSLVVSRSNYAGSGKYGAHWLGDNASTFRDMAVSITGEGGREGGREGGEEQYQV